MVEKLKSYNKMIRMDRMMMSTKNSIKQVKIEKILE